MTIQQMIIDWNLNYQDFIERLSERFKFDVEEIQHDDSYLLNFVSQLPILQGASSGTYQNIIKIAELKTYFEGDRISDAEIENNLIFVAEGKLVRSIETGDGWYNTLDIVKENRWINETVLLENRKTKN